MERFTAPKRPRRSAASSRSCVWQAAILIAIAAGPAGLLAPALGAPSFDSQHQATCVSVGCHPVQNSGRIPTHSPYLEEQCSLCHLDHTSRQKNLLRDGGDELCLGCHIELRGSDSGLAPDHVAGDRQCVDCHAPHQSRLSRYLRDEQKQQICSECHEEFLLAAESRDYRHDYFEPRGDCGECHYAHQRAEFKYMRENVAETCLTCHDLPIHVEGRPLENIGESLRSADWIHAPMRDKESCPKCHTPHGSDQSSLLKDGYPSGHYKKYESDHYALCWQCHSRELAESADQTQATEFRQGSTNLHRLHLIDLGQGRGCGLCHSPHASDQPHLIKKRVLFGKWEAPMSYEALPEGGRCVTACHRVKEYSRAGAPPPPSTP